MRRDAHIARLMAAPMELAVHGQPVLLWPLRQCDLGALQRWVQTWCDLPGPIALDDARSLHALLERDGLVQLVGLSVRRSFDAITIAGWLDDSVARQRLLKAMVRLNDGPVLADRAMACAAIAARFGWRMDDIAQLTPGQVALLLQDHRSAGTRVFRSRQEWARFRARRLAKETSW